MTSMGSSDRSQFLSSSMLHWNATFQQQCRCFLVKGKSLVNVINVIRFDVSKRGQCIYANFEW